MSRFDPSNNRPDPTKPATLLCSGKEVYPEGMPPVACPACLCSIIPGEIYTRVPVGPGGDPKKRAAARMGSPYESAVLGIHWACVTGDETGSVLSV